MHLIPDYIRLDLPLLNAVFILRHHMGCSSLCVAAEFEVQMVEFFLFSSYQKPSPHHESEPFRQRAPTTILGFLLSSVRRSQRWS